MKHWEKVLPLKVMNVSYEELVADTEKVSREMLSFLDQSWDGGVLDFHKSERICVTASYAQVREPIYSTSIGKAERYRHRIGELVTLAQLGQ